MLAEYPHPVLISHGDSGPAAYAAVVRMLREAVPRASLEVIRGAGHAPHLTNPADMARVVVAAASR